MTGRAGPVNFNSAPLSSLVAYGFQAFHAVVSMVRCLNEQCKIRATYNVPLKGMMGAFCKQHAKDGMINMFRKRCSHAACTRHPSFNLDGIKTAVFCKEHADKEMVNVLNRHCSDDSCTRRPNFGVEGSKTAVYCRQHAEDGMVNVLAKRCFYDSCTRQPSFNVEGGKKAVYCRQHAEDGMVDVHAKRCAHDSCSTIPSYNVEGTKKPAYCKQHAKGGMVDVRTKRCSHDSCWKRPSFQFEGGKSAKYCKQHAHHSMVNFRSKTFLHESCSKPHNKVDGGNAAEFAKKNVHDGTANVRRKLCSDKSCFENAGYDVVGSKTPVYCKTHSKDDMVKIRSNRLAVDRNGTWSARDVSTNVVAAAKTSTKDDSMGSPAITPEVGGSRGRARSELDGEQSSHYLDNGAFKEGGIVHAVGMGPSGSCPHTLLSRALPERADVNTVGKKAGRRIRRTMTPLPYKQQSAEPIKTEMGVDVSS